MMVKMGWKSNIGSDSISCKSWKSSLTLYSVGDAEQCQRMLLPRTLRAVLVLDALLDAAAGNRTVRAHVIGVVVIHPVEHRLADAHRLGEELDLDAPRAVMAGAALD